jgi:hypothetical protein
MATIKRRNLAAGILLWKVITCGEHFIGRNPRLTRRAIRDCKMFALADCSAACSAACHPAFRIDDLMIFAPLARNVLQPCGSVYVWQDYSWGGHHFAAGRMAGSNSVIFDGPASASAKMVDVILMTNVAG